VIELLLQMNKDLNTTLVLVTHDPALAERCDAQLELDAGCIVGHRGPVLMAHEASS
jgi:putative ABC transport system ATP-binding protein